MKELYDIKDMVIEELTNNTRAREDDFTLYSCICAKKCGVGVLLIPFGTLMKMHKAYGLPHFETVRRARQKAQAENPELCSEETKRRRALKEEEYREFARS